MFIQPYAPHELHFAYCYRIFLRVRTHCVQNYEVLDSLTRNELRDLLQPYSVRVLELSSNNTDFLTMLSLVPQESISTAVSKTKGRVSKWMREEMELLNPGQLLSRGYFGCTIGKSRKQAVERYLSKQAEHHRYLNRIVPPVFEKQFSLRASDLDRTSPKHGLVIAQFHIVLATTHRKGVFGSRDGELITDTWRRVLSQCALIKVSFVPDHVHIALRAHPALAPADIVTTLMNSAQEVAGTQMMRAGIDRLWQPSAYLGSYGDLASPQIKKYFGEWEKGQH